MANFASGGVDEEDIEENDRYPDLARECKNLPNPIQDFQRILNEIHLSHKEALSGFREMKMCRAGTILVRSSTGATELVGNTIHELEVCPDHKLLGTVD